MRKAIRQHIQRCQSCQANKGSNQLPIGLLQPLDIPGKRWETVSMDLITSLPSTRRGNDAIIVFVDKFSKMVHYAATTTTCTAVDVARIFFDTVVRLHGIPQHIVSARDPRFTSRFWKQLWTLLGTELKMIHHIIHKQMARRSVPTGHWKTYYDTMSANNRMIGMSILQQQR